MNNSGSYSSGNLGLSFGKGSNPPNLEDYSSDPKYDLTTVVQIVRVRPMILWGWEQQLGIPSPMRVPDDSGGNGRRYSERDIVASLWLREQILSNVSPNEAAARLLGSNNRVNTGPLDQSQRERGNSGRLGENGGLARSAKPTIRLRDLESPRTSGPLPPAPEAPIYGPAYEPHYGPGVPGPSGALGSSFPGTPPGSGRLSRPGGLYPPNTGELILETNAVRPGTVSGPNPFTRLKSGPLMDQRGPTVVEGAPITGSIEHGRQFSEMSAPGVPWSGPGAQERRGSDLRSLQSQFIRAFSTFNTRDANSILSEALGTRSVESVCAGLLLPALSRISDLASRHEASTPEERFAVNYAKSFLFAILHRTAERNDGPLAFIGCGPKELSEINALTLAVFWRRAGLRVIYLGQDIEAESLVTEVRKRRPAMVTLTVTTGQRIRSLARLSKALNQVEPPRPVVGFCGPIFVRNPELQRKITGIYLGDDPATATWHVTNLLGTDRGPAAGGGAPTI